MMRGLELREWRKRNGYTQEMLRMALQIGSRQTIISWEKSEDPVARPIQLALLALEYLPEKCSLVTGRRYSAGEYPQQRKRGPKSLAG
jgi:DNA-binding XRE family transcriptional regulator